MSPESPETSHKPEFERLTLPHLSSLYNTAVWLTRNSHEAQDLVQETLLTAYRFFSRFTPGTNYRAWLFTILRNLYRNFFRKQLRQPEAEALEIPMGTVKSRIARGKQLLKLFLLKQVGLREPKGA